MVNLLIWANLNQQERLDIIKPLWDAGQSYTVIAETFVDGNRNKICGAINRAKLMRRPTNVAKPIRVPRAPKPIIDPPPAPVKPVAQETFDMINQNRPALAGHVPISILELPNRAGVRCRFPVQGGYCGAPSGDRSYCPDHAALAFRPTDPITKPPKEARL